MSDHIHIPKNFFEKKRDEFLALTYDGHFEAAERTYRQIAHKIELTQTLTEPEIKAVRQIQQAVRIFRKEVYEKGRLDRDYESVRKRLAKDARNQTRAPEHIEYDVWLSKTGLSQKQLAILFRTVSTLQLTVGCSVFCRRCNEWALPGPRKHFTFDAAKRLIKSISDAGNQEYALYCASDPLDWSVKGKTILDLLEFMSRHGYRSRYGLLTKIPKGAEKTILALLDAGVDIGFSMTNRNRSAIKKIERKTGQTLDVQHDFDDLLIPSGLDEDFSGIRSSITDHYGAEITPEGAFLVIPTFTSALNPTGQRRIPLTLNTDFFLKKRIGRDAWRVEYFKPLRAVDLEGREFNLERLFDAQIENILLDIGSEKVTPPGMMNIKEYLRTYEPEVVQRRKTLFPAVIKDLKETVLFQDKCREDSKIKRLRRFKSRVRAYYETCRPENMAEYRKNAFSFYLRSIADYLKTHPVEKRIIRHLRKQSEKNNEPGLRPFPNGSVHTVESLLDSSEVDSFELFQILISWLIEDPDHQEIQAFIKDRPVNSTDHML